MRDLTLDVDPKLLYALLIKVSTRLKIPSS